jgi:hypothetical protein
MRRVWRSCCVPWQVDGLAAVAAALSCNSQLASLSLAGSGISGACMAAMAAAGLAAAAALATLDISVPDAKVSRCNVPADRLHTIWQMQQQHCSSWGVARHAPSLTP